MSVHMQQQQRNIITNDNYENYNKKLRTSINAHRQTLVFYSLVHFLATKSSTD